MSLPLLTIEPVAFEQPDAATLSAFDILVFTSANGVRCFADALSPRAQEALRNHRNVAVVGPATARALLSMGCSTPRTPHKYVAEALLDLLTDVTGRTILWPRGDRARPVLSAGLRARGGDLTELVVYRTAPATPPRTASVPPEGDAVAFTSPSAVDAWVSAFGIPRMRAVCIGPVTAQCARNFGVTVNAIADAHTMDGLISALHRAFEQRKEGAA